MMKRKFGDGLRSKTDTAMVNETLCKVLFHNLIHETRELGIDSMFWSNKADTPSRSRWISLARRGISSPVGRVQQVILANGKKLAGDARNTAGER